MNYVFVTSSVGAQSYTTSQFHRPLTLKLPNTVKIQKLFDRLHPAMHEILPSPDERHPLNDEA